VLSAKSRVNVGCFRERLSLVNTLPTKRFGSTPMLRGTGRRRDLEDDDGSRGGVRGHELISEDSEHEGED
jgi:hypothetical protein